MRSAVALAAAVSLAVASAGPARADAPLVLVPPALGRPDRVWIAGRAIEERHDRGPGPWRTARRLAAESWEGSPVEVRLLGRTARTTSGQDGAFEVELAADPGAPFPSGPQVGEVSIPGARAAAVVHVVPPDAPYLVVSDLDDTVAVTNVGQVGKLLASVFLMDEATQPAVPGMAALYRCLAAARPPPAFAYVSGSPVQLSPRVEAFLALNGFPPAALHLRDVGPGTLSGYKEPVLERLAARFPQPFVLVGDSGERDPEIYAAFARAHPGRVRAIYVRRAGEPGPASRFAGEVLFADPAEAGRDAAARGIAPACGDAAR